MIWIKCLFYLTLLEAKCQYLSSKVLIKQFHKLYLLKNCYFENFLFALNHSKVKENDFIKYKTDTMLIFFN